jgi:hypothetical protein
MIVYGQRLKNCVPRLTDLFLVLHQHIEIRIEVIAVIVTETAVIVTEIAVIVTEIAVIQEIEDPEKETAIETGIETQFETRIPRIETTYERDMILDEIQGSATEKDHPLDWEEVLPMKSITFVLNLRR